LQETFYYGRENHTKTQKTLENTDGLNITSWIIKARLLHLPHFLRCLSLAGI